jgi:hypothetical protein
MRQSFFLIMLLAATLFLMSANESPLNPFSSLRFDKAIAYDFNGEHEMPLVVNGKVNQFAVNKQYVLRPSQLDSLHTLLNDTNTYGGEEAACFEPHLGIVYFSGDSIVAHTEICFECNYLNSTVEIPAIQYYFGGKGYGRGGFSEKGINQLSSFCRSLGFSHCTAQH